MDNDSWKDLVLDVVRKISDENYQKNTWFGGGDSISSPQELYCQLFDDFMYEDFLISEDINITTAQREMGKCLENAMNQYTNKIDYIKDPKKVFDDSRWNNIRKIAKGFIKTMDKSL